MDLIQRKMRHDKRYTHILNKDYLTDVSNAAPLHDIGKISTPDSILQKPGKLTDQEYAIMKEHAAKGGEIIRTAFHNLEDPEFRRIAYEVARYHHEKYNCKGYPDGLSGEQIPLHARIMAIADYLMPYPKSGATGTPYPWRRALPSSKKAAERILTRILPGFSWTPERTLHKSCRNPSPLFPEQNIGADSLLTLRAHLL